MTKTTEGNPEGFYNGLISECNADFCHYIALYVPSPGGGIVPWSHEPINKPHSFLNSQDGNFLSKNHIFKPSFIHLQSKL